MKLVSMATAILALTLAHGAGAAEDASAAGFWITGDNGAVVEIAPCGDALCGHIAGLRLDHKPGDAPVDSKNPDPAKRNTPMCGLPLMGDLKPVKSSATKWDGGWVYDPESGSKYTAEMHLDGPDTLKLRGFVGISLFGRTETWKRESGANKNRCVAPHG